MATHNSRESVASRTWLDHIIKSQKQIVKIGAYLGALLIFLSMIMVAFDTILRYAFNRPLAVVDELITCYFLAYITLLPAAWILEQDGHVKVDIFVVNLSPRKRRIFDTFNGALGFICSIILIWQGWLMAWSYLGSNFTATYPWPTFPGYISVPIAGLLLATAFVVKIVGCWRKVKETA